MLTTATTRLVNLRAGFKQRSESRQQVGHEEIASTGGVRRGNRRENNNAIHTIERFFV